jgi:steroid 5-alpha reductase family enzyme
MSLAHFLGVDLAHDVVSAVDVFASRAPTDAATSSAFCMTLALLGCFISASWVLQLSTGWWSWVDRLWSITPVVYAIVRPALRVPRGARGCAIGGPLKI